MYVEGFGTGDQVLGKLIHSKAKLSRRHRIHCEFNKFYTCKMLRDSKLCALGNCGSWLRNKLYKVVSLGWFGKFKHYKTPAVKSWAAQFVSLKNFRPASFKGTEKHTPKAPNPIRVPIHTLPNTSECTPV